MKPEPKCKKSKSFYGFYTVWHPGIIMCMRPANVRRRYIVTSSLIGWEHTQNDLCVITKPQIKSLQGKPFAAAMQVIDTTWMVSNIFCFIISDIGNSLASW